MLIILALLSESYVKKKLQTAALESHQVTLSTQNALHMQNNSGHNVLKHEDSIVLQEKAPRIL